MIDFPRIIISVSLIILVSIFLYPISEDILHLAFAVLAIAIIITLLAFREMIGLVLFIFLAALVVVFAVTGNIPFAVLVGSIVIIIFIFIDIIIY